LDAYRNFYINIALPFFIASEPLACATQHIGSVELQLDRLRKRYFCSKFEVNIWSSFEIQGHVDMTLEQFIGEVQVERRPCH
jgi:hypothetical protein